MIKVIVGKKRFISDGKLKGKDGKPLEFDTVHLLVASLDTMTGNGIQAIEPYKIPKARFADVIGIDYDTFESNFEDNFFGHEVSMLGTLNAYGKFEVSQVSVSEEPYWAKLN